ncbi:phosphoribosylglycinamide formyltransferase [Lamprobacter modestohalophilus]|uniref:Phosphoribosylglycinamide formyltransferase n=1 Tax=Lamprobacter modestohalophilus TaxID=1064514 RepID=A0A9X0WDR6_9GAMM|nr:phosphoribosylglycinamide formyltransferase [Lamprobacter modestohalophilus]MBK1621153.1 phosphoribosylglycinamide formyltransferase [Lamprobacter modestohalophilus]
MNENNPNTAKDVVDGSPPLRLAVLISGSGSNLQALIDASQQADSPFEIAVVISNRADAFGLERAQRAGIATQVLSHRDFDSRTAYDTALAELLRAADPELIALAGFMRILTPGFVEQWQGRLLNIHPSLLPRYRGLHTHQRVLEAGDPVHGATVHFVTAELDGGPAIVQARVPVLADDEPDQLAARVLEQEHRIYPLAVRWFAEDRLVLSSDGRTQLDGEPLDSPVIIDTAR